MKQLLLTEIHLDELRTAIADAVKSELKNELPTLFPVNQPADFLTRKQTASVLGISLPTLNEWTKQGKIPAYRIGTRVRYVRSEVEQSLTQVKSINTRRFHA